MRDSSSTPILILTTRLATGDRLLPLWVVFRFPLDFPNHYVVRVQWACKSGQTDKEPIACLYGTLEEAMFDCEAQGLVWIGRQLLDEPQIVGVWL